MHNRNSECKITCLVIIKLYKVIICLFKESSTGKLTDNILTDRIIILEY